MENYKELLNRYLNNELEGEELKLLLLWMHDPSNSELLEKWMGEDWDSFVFATEIKANTKYSFEVLKTKIERQQLKVKRNNIKIKFNFYRVAASILIPIAIGWLSYLVFSKYPNIHTIAYNEISVPIGSKTLISLADGTKIWLNAGSKLRYPQRFVGNTREVELEGEGYFVVAQNPKMPFFVRTHDINIKVLGTSFNVKSYPEERTVETTLVEGLVTISKSNLTDVCKEVVLKPNQRATFLKESGKLVLSANEKELITKTKSTDNKNNNVEKQMILHKNIDTEQYIAWKDNKLIFKNEEFESLCTRLERWFDVKINIKDNELKKYHYTGTIENETINDIIDILQLTMHFKYSINHSVIEIWTE